MIRSFNPSHLMALLVMIATMTAMAPAHAENFNGDQKKEIEQIVKQYLLDNPEVLYQAAENHQRSEEKKAQETASKFLQDSQKELFGNDDVPFIGNPKGTVAIVEFFDYNCGYCKQAMPQLLQFIEQNKDAKIILMDTPVMSRESLEAAKWALAAKKFGKYAEVHQALMQFQGPKSKENLTRIVKQAGLDPEKIAAEAESEEIRNLLVANMQMFRGLGLDGTPAFVTRDRVIRGYAGAEVLGQIAKEIRTSAATTKKQVIK